IDLDSDEESNLDDEKVESLKGKFEDLIPSKYAVNDDSTMLMLRFLPAGSTSDINYLSRMFNAYDSLYATMSPSTFNNQMEVDYGGRLHLKLVQFKSVMNDVFNSFGIGVSAVVLLVVLYFFIVKYVNYRRGSLEDQKHSLWQHIMRIPVPAFIIGIPLIISLALTFGITYWVLGTLNIMTAVLFVILFGLGIDYGIHFYGRYIELRSEGFTVKGALTKTYNNTGRALITTALTTAVSLFVLVFANFR